MSPFPLANVFRNALNWLWQFAEQHNRMLLYSEQIEVNGVFTNKQRVAAYGPPAFQQEMAQRMASGDMPLGILPTGKASA